MLNEILGVPEIVFVDFDSTLSANIWEDGLIENPISSDSYINWEAICKTNPNTYALCQPVPCVARAIKFFRKKGSRIILLGWEDKHFTRKLKEQWIDSHFPDDFEDRIFTGSAEKKIKIMEVYCLTENIDRQKIAIIEDRPSTCELANQEGFLAWTLSFIALTFDSEVSLPTL